MRFMSWGVRIHYILNYPLYWTGLQKDGIASGVPVRSCASLFTAPHGTTPERLLNNAFVNIQYRVPQQREHLVEFTWSINFENEPEHQKTLCTRSSTQLLEPSELTGFIFQVLSTEERYARFPRSSPDMASLSSEWYETASIYDIFHVIDRQFELLYLLQWRYRYLRITYHRIDKTVREHPWTDITHIRLARHLFTPLGDAQGQSRDITDNLKTTLDSADEEMLHNGKSEALQQHLLDAAQEIHRIKRQLDLVAGAVFEVLRISMMLYDGSEDMYYDHADQDNDRRA